MVSIKETAQAYEPSTMKNISDLDMVSTDLDVQEETKENAQGESYLVRFVVINDEQYRMPFTVIKDLKAILEKKPDLKSFCVSRTGTTKEDTRYQTIPL